MWRRPRLVTADTKSPSPQPAHRAAGGVEPSRRTRQRGRRRELGRQRREACLPVAREGSCLASVASRVTARHVQGWTSLGAPPIPSLGGSAATKGKKKEGNPGAETRRGSDRGRA